MNNEYLVLEILELWIIHYFHLDHNTPPLQKEKKICITIVLNFSWNDCNTHKKLKKMGMMYYSLCGNGE